MTCACAAQLAAHIPGESAHVGALAAFGFQHRRRPVGHVDEAEVFDHDPARLEHDQLAAAREVIGAVAVDLDGRKARRNLAYLAPEFPSTLSISSADGSTSDVRTTSPSASSVSVSAPKRTVKR